MYEDELNFDAHEFDDINDEDGICDDELDEDILELLRSSISSSSYDGLDQSDFEDDEDDQEDYDNL